MDKLGSLGVMANFVGELQAEKPPEEEEKQYHINTQSGMTFGVGVVKKVKIQMDTSKAMAILGFSSSQTFEATKLDEVEKAFKRKIEGLLKQKKKKRKNSLNPKADEDNLNNQIRNLNEAMQFLARKRTRSHQVVESWHLKGTKTALISMALDAMTVDERTKMMRQPGYLEKMQKVQQEQEQASKNAVEMAEALIAGIDERHKEVEENSKAKKGSKKREKKASTEGASEQVASDGSNTLKPVPVASTTSISSTDSSNSTLTVSGSSGGPQRKKSRKDSRRKSSAKTSSYVSSDQKKKEPKEEKKSSIRKSRSHNDLKSSLKKSQDDEEENGGEQFRDLVTDLTAYEIDQFQGLQLSSQL